MFLSVYNSGLKCCLPSIGVSINVLKMMAQDKVMLRAWIAFALL